MSAAWSVQELEACFIVTDSAGRTPHRYRPPLVADVAYWPKADIEIAPRNVRYQKVVSTGRRNTLSQGEKIESVGR